MVLKIIISLKKFFEISKQIYLWISDHVSWLQSFSIINWTSNLQGLFTEWYFKPQITIHVSIQCIRPNLFTCLFLQTFQSSTPRNTLDRSRKFCQLGFSSFFIRIDTTYNRLLYIFFLACSPQHNLSYFVLVTFQP